MKNVVRSLRTTASRSRSPRLRARESDVRWRASERPSRRRWRRDHRLPKCPGQRTRRDAGRSTLHPPLSNLDKHRTLTTVATSIRTSKWKDGSTCLASRAPISHISTSVVTSGVSAAERLVGSILEPTDLDAIGQGNSLKLDCALSSVKPANLSRHWRHVSKT